MSNRIPAGPATKSKNRHLYQAAALVLLCCIVLAGPALPQTVENPVTGHTYEYVRLRGFIYWDQAQEAAAARGGYLATVTDSIEAGIVASLFAYPGQKAFLGASDANDSCLWRWVTGEPWGYENWAFGEPGGEEPCVNSLRTSFELQGAWEADVGPLDGYVIEWNGQNNDTLLNLQQWPVSVGGNGHWYGVIPRWVSWYEADSLAKGIEIQGATGHLATVTSPEENQFILDHILINAWPDTVVLLESAYWLGGERSYGGGWEWVTGEPFVYTNWADSLPFGNDAGMVIAMVGYGFDINPPLPGQWVPRYPDCDAGIMSCLWAVVEFDVQAPEPRVLYVPQEYPSIQSAIDAAWHGDIVHVGPGVYHEAINFSGKNIVVRSAEGPLATTITNERTVTLVTFEFGETRSAVLEGFTLRGGWIAVLCVNSSPTIRHNICVEQNVWNWAAVCLSGPLDTIIDPSGDPRYGANMGPAAAALINNTIVYSANGGISNFSTVPPEIRNNIVAFNAHYGVHQQSPSGQPQPILGYNAVYGHGPHTTGPYGDYINIPDPGPGSISADPLFGANCALTPESPCINAGDPDLIYNDPDGSRNDMGAMPFFAGPGGVIPTDQWIVVYCDHAPTINLPDYFSIIQAFDPQGVLCGETARFGDGRYGYMPIYRDDPYTDIDEGCDPGDLIQFKIDFIPAEPSTPVHWTTNGDVFEVCDFGYARCVNIPLHAGWNLVSWNVAFESDIRTALDEIIGCVEVVHSYEQGGLTFDPLLDQYNTLTHVDYHHGYWIRMRCDAVLQICGSQIPLEEWISLEAGWNLVSYWPEWPLPVEQGFNSILDSLQEAMGFDNGAQVWLPNMPYLNTLTQLRPSFGFWVKTAAAVPLVYPRGILFDTIIFPPDSGWVESPPLVEPSRNWMSVYGDNLTIDGAPLSDGAVISVCTEESVICGRGEYRGGILRLTPVYGQDGSGQASKHYPAAGDRLGVFVDGRRVYPDLQWSSGGERVRLSRLSTDSHGLPLEFALAQNYPNPFNSGTVIEYDVPSQTNVTIDIFNVLGQKVRTLVNKITSAGSYRIEWTGTDDAGRPVATGVYLYRFRAGDVVQTKKMLLLK